MDVFQDGQVEIQMLSCVKRKVLRGTESETEDTKLFNVVWLENCAPWELKTEEILTWSYLGHLQI